MDSPSQIIQRDFIEKIRELDIPDFWAPDPPVRRPRWWERVWRWFR